MTRRNPRRENKGMKMIAIQTLKVNGGEIELVKTNGRFQWFLGDEDCEVGGETIEEARTAAYAAWPEAEQLN